MRFIFDERFAAGFFNDPCRRVYGMQLQPFSYWHKVQLEYVHSRFLTGEEIRKWDVWVAAKVLTTKYPETARLKKEYSAWWYLLWRVVYGWRSLLQGHVAIVRHINNFSSGPKLWPKGGALRRLADAYKLMADETGDQEFLKKAYIATRDADLQDVGKRDIDDSIEQVSIYMKYGGRPAEEAWNMPLGQLLWYNICFLKMESGDVPVWSPTDEIMFQQHKRERHKKLLGLAAEKQKEHPGLTDALAFAMVSVEYWEEVVAASKGSVGKR